MLHEPGSLLAIPGSLGLVEYHDPVDRRLVPIAKPLIPKVVHVLDKGLDGLACVGLGDPLTELFSARHVVTRQGFAEHGDQRTISGQIDGVGIVAFAV